MSPSHRVFATILGTGVAGGVGVGIWLGIRNLVYVRRENKAAAVEPDFSEDGIRHYLGNNLPAEETGKSCPLHDNFERLFHRDRHHHDQIEKTLVQ